MTFICGSIKATPIAVKQHYIGNQPKEEEIKQCATFICLQLQRLIQIPWVKTLSKTNKFKIQKTISL